jgi:hypothetical protein
MSLLDQADNPRRLVESNDGSEGRLCTYPYATVLDGIPWWVQSYRLSDPSHRFESQSPRWGLCITPASEGEEFHLYLPQVIKIYNLDLSSPASRPFRENGSQRHLILHTSFDESRKALRRRPHLCDGLLSRPGNCSGRLHQH